jgi:hypothetical protein
MRGMNIPISATPGYRQWFIRITQRIEVQCCHPHRLLDTAITITSMLDQRIEVLPDKGQSINMAVAHMTQ